MRCRKASSTRSPPDRRKGWLDDAKRGTKTGRFRGLPVLADKESRCGGPPDLRGSSGQVVLPERVPLRYEKRRHVMPCELEPAGLRINDVSMLAEKALVLGLAPGNAFLFPILRRSRLR